VGLDLFLRILTGEFCPAILRASEDLIFLATALLQMMHQIFGARKRLATIIRANKPGPEPVLLFIPCVGVRDGFRFYLNFFRIFL
jgi:hypothetical protein